VVTLASVYHNKYNMDNILSFFLAVVCIFAVLPEIVFIQQFLLHDAESRIHCHSVVCHKCQFLENYGIVNGMSWVFSPGKRTMRIYEYGWNIVV